MLLTALLVIGIALGSQLVARSAATAATVTRLLAGLALGPSGAGLLHIDIAVQVLAATGMAYLLFVGGMELERRVRAGRALTNALAAFGASGILAGSSAVAVSAIAGIHDVPVVAAALLTTLLMPTIGVLAATGRESRELGNFTILAGTLGDAAAIAVILGTAMSGAPAVSAAILCVLAGTATALRPWAPAKRPVEARPQRWIAVLAPMSFVSAGARIDVAAVLRSPRDVVLVPTRLLVMVVCRALPARLCAPRRSDLRERHGAGLLLATKLTLVVVAVQLARAQGSLASGAGSALLLSAEITVCVFPAIAGSLLARQACQPEHDRLVLLDRDPRPPVAEGDCLVKHHCTPGPHGACPTACR
jgi:hypothetical protein